MTYKLPNSRKSNFATEPTFLHTVLGELAPKSLAIQCTEPVALWTATPLHVFYLYTTRDTLWRASFASA